MRHVGMHKPNQAYIVLNAISKPLVKEAPMIKLVLSDIDGTLLPFGAPRVSARTMAAIEELRDADIEFGLATGRNIREIRGFFAGETSAYRTGILANGMRVRVNGRDSMYSMLDNSALQRLTDHLAQVPGVFLCLFEKDDTGTVAPKVVGCTSDEHEAFEANVIPLGAELIARVPDRDIPSASIGSLAGQAVLDEVKASAREIASCFDYLQPIENWCDVLPAGMNKGSGVEVLARELGISLDEILFFGDAENDLPIFGTLENTCATANATAAAKAAARWHVGSCEEDGVAAALEELARATRENKTPAFMS